MPTWKDNFDKLPQVEETYVELKVNLDFSIKKSGIQSLAILSAGQGEGRTTCCLNLAVLYAKAGKKVVVLDANLRNPSLHSWFRDSNQTGLSTYLAKRTPYGELVKDSGYSNLMYIPAGTSPMNPSELLSSVEMDSLMAELKQSFDLIIMDTPPALQHIDAKIAASKCDGVLLVLEYGKVKPAAALKLKEELVHAEARLLGTVLNKVVRKSS
ncbi:CpsD/CapB family tyrosine-protein kinase [Paenibacillus filicis]|uniref:non-specific protein-tyrosine kinase n=1 Tax=Paenibacillus gyeongsangnamensis TaxID=3388067 RepID=A0ABT4QHX1_9BACL|nr:CpsD/CapB family tyrosine-protein kinase [Paenibacillus filicis]MCZ8516481.1 CpsD/CapB family tyrosine-protein kinase [Paenibacillus filicis]